MSQKQRLQRPTKIRKICLGNNSCHPVTVEWFSIQILVNVKICITVVDSFPYALQGTNCLEFALWSFGKPINVPSSTILNIVMQCTSD